jgi:hypothetical protein
MVRAKANTQAVIEVPLTEFGKPAGVLHVDRTQITGVAAMPNFTDWPFVIHIGSAPVRYGIDQATYERISSLISA